MKFTALALAAALSVPLLIPTHAHAQYMSCSIYLTNCATPVATDNHDHEGHEEEGHATSANQNRQLFANFLVSFINYSFFAPKPYPIQPTSYQPSLPFQQPMPQNQQAFPGYAPISYTPIGLPTGCTCGTGYQPTGYGFSSPSLGVTNPYGFGTASYPMSGPLTNGVNSFANPPSYQLPAYSSFGYGSGNVFGGNATGGHFAGDGHNH